MPIMGTSPEVDLPGAATPSTDECTPVIGMIADGDSPEAIVDATGAIRIESCAGDSHVGPVEVLVGAQSGMRGEAWVVETASVHGVGIGDDVPSMINGEGSPGTSESAWTMFAGAICYSCKGDSKIGNIDTAGSLVELVIKLSHGLGDGRMRTSECYWALAYGWRDLKGNTDSSKITSHEI
jgi:hypothetical protein